MALATCGGATLANTLLTTLTAGKNFSFPSINLSDPAYQLPDLTGVFAQTVAPITVAALTSGTVDGTGVFDVLMKAVSAHLSQEFQKNRITGREYAETYLASTTAAMNTAVNFLLQKDSTYWAAQQARINASRAQIEHKTALAQLSAMAFQSLTAEADYGLTKMKVASEDQQLCLLDLQKQTAQYTLTNLLPKQLETATKQNTILDRQAAQLSAQTTKIDIERQIDNYNLTSMLPKQRDLLVAQAELADVQYRSAEYNMTTVLPQQLALIKEQIEVQRAQTSDTRADGTAIKGSIGKQKDLYTQQIESYKLDGKVKTGKIWTDSFIAMKTIDETLTPPTNLANTTINSILASLKADADI